MALPADERVKIGLDGIELDAAAERELVNLLGSSLTVRGTTASAGGGSGGLRRDRHVPEDAEVEDRLLRRIETFAVE